MEHLSQHRIPGLHVVDGPVPVTERPGGHVVEVTGDLDLYTGPSLRQALFALADEQPGRRVAVDLSGLRFLDSSGLGVLIAGLKRIRAGGGTLALVGCAGAVLEVLVVTGLDRAFPLHDTVDEALAE